MQLTGRASGIVVDEDLNRIDFGRVQGWLSGTYWSPGIAREKVERAAQHSSLVIGAYDMEQNGRQVGYMRIVSDRTSFAYICDVYVDEAYRGQGIARAMVGYALDHPEHQGLRRWILATRDAHDVYRGLGFETLPNPERWLTYLPGQCDPGQLESGPSDPGKQV